MSRYIVKAICLENPKHLIISNGGSTFFCYQFSLTHALDGNSLNLQLLLIFFFDLICLGYGFYVQGIVNPMDVLKIFVKQRDPDIAMR
jgi:hypothetical protein